MNMDQAAVFLAGSILTALGFVVVVAAIIVVNYLLATYWKPLRIFSADSFQPFGQNPRYMTNEEYNKSQEPTLETKDKK